MGFLTTATDIMELVIKVNQSGLHNAYVVCHEFGEIFSPINEAETKFFANITLFSCLSSSFLPFLLSLFWFPLNVGLSVEI